MDCGYSLEPHRRDGSNEYPQSTFWAEIWKDIRIFIWELTVFSGEIINIFELASFRNEEFYTTQASLFISQKSMTSPLQV